MKSSRFRNLLSKSLMDNLTSIKPYFNWRTHRWSKSSIKIKTSILHRSTFMKTNHFNNAGKLSIKRILTHCQKSNTTKISSNKKYKTWKLKTKNLKESFKKWSNSLKTIKKYILSHFLTKKCHHSPIKIKTHRRLSQIKTQDRLLLKTQKYLHSVLEKKK